MSKSLHLSVAVITVVSGVSAVSADTTTYGYDALGRLTKVDIAGGTMDGFRRAYQYDPAGNRQSVSHGTWLPTPIVPASSRLNFMGNNDVVMTVNVGTSNAGGSISVWFNDVFMGTAQVTNGVATLNFQQLTPGTYTVRVDYSGDAAHDANTYTFTAKVNDLSWLPSVLDLILQ